jgi:hypothetical protein
VNTTSNKPLDRNAVLLYRVASFLIVGVTRSAIHEETAEVVEPTYLVRYGVMAHVGRFFCSLDGGGPFQRGQRVVIETERGVELGEVLAMVETPTTSARRQGDDYGQLDGNDDSARLPRKPRAEVLRSATTEEIARGDPGAQARTGHFELCRRTLQQFNWPWELIDVESLLDNHKVVLHYLGPRELDQAAVRAWFRTAHDLEVVFEPVGSEESNERTSGAAEGASSDGCGASGCGHGGCGSDVAARDSSAASNGHGCGTPAHSGCSSCGIMRAMAARSERKGQHERPGYATPSASP